MLHIDRHSKCVFALIIVRRLAGKDKILFLELLLLYILGIANCERIYAQLSSIKNNAGKITFGSYFL